MLKNDEVAALLGSGMSQKDIDRVSAEAAAFGRKVVDMISTELGDGDNISLEQAAIASMALEAVIAYIQTTVNESMNAVEHTSAGVGIPLDESARVP